MLLSAVLCFGRTGSDEDTAHAIRGVLRLQESVHDPTSLQVSRAVVTNKGVCIEYRSRNASGGMSAGFAVYKTDKDLVWVDNSWLWDQVCLVGKYGQRRDGKDATEVVSAALKEKQAPALSSQPAPSAPHMAGAAVASASAVQPATPAARVETVALTVTAPAAQAVPMSVSPVQAAAQAVPPPGSVRKSAAIAQEASVVVAAAPVATAPAVQPAAPAARVETLVLTAETPVAAAAPASVAPVPAAKAAVTQATTVAKPVETPAPTAQAEVVVEVAPASAQPASGVQPRPTAPAAQAPVLSASSYVVSSAPIAAVELGTIRGVTIVDNTGALERKGPPPAPESLGDAARRLRHAKQQ